MPPSPASCDYSAPAMTVIANIEGNDSVGDCVLAEEAHFVAVATGNAGQLYSYTAAQTLAAYSAITGYNPANPDSDQGTDPIVALNYFCANPYADGTKLLGYAEVDMSNQAEVEFAISAFGNLKMWLGLPDSYVNPFPSGNGFVWDVAPADQANGHCIGSPAYNSPNVAVVGANSQGVQVMTWGLLGTMTWAAVKALCVPSANGGAAVRVTPDWLIKSSGKTPSGFAYADLVSDFNKVFGGNLPVPSPAPGPAPTAPPTLSAAQSATAAALQAASPLLTRAQASSVVNAALSPLWPSP